MGNQNAKVLHENDSRSTERCPQRNRSVHSVHNTGSQITNYKSKCQRNISERDPKKMAAKDEKSVEVQNKSQLPVIIEGSLKAEKSGKFLGKKSLKKRSRKRDPILEAPKENNAPNMRQGNLKNSNVPSRKQSSKLRKRHSSITSSPYEATLITDILNTVAELESTFLDEKKYERRLRSSFSKQIESTQQLKLSLHIEKERNKRLMELMNRYDNPESSIFKESNNDGMEKSSPRLQAKYLDNKADDGNSFHWTHRHAFSNLTDISTSPVLMRQRYEELSKSYAKCQCELQRKDKLLTLAHCKQEALQAKCDRLTEQFLASQRRIESLYRRNADLRKKYGKKVQSDCSEINESESEIEEKKAQQLIFVSRSNDIRDDGDQKREFLKDVSKNESENFIKKTKEE